MQRSGNGERLVDRAIIERLLPPGAGSAMAASDLDEILGRKRDGAPSRVPAVHVVAVELGQGFGDLTMPSGTEDCVAVVRWSGRPLGVVEVPFSGKVLVGTALAAAIARQLEWPIARAALIDWVRAGAARLEPLLNPPLPHDRAAEPHTVRRMWSEADGSRLYALATEESVELIEIASGAVIDDPTTAGAIAQTFRNDPTLAALWVPAVPGRVGSHAEYRALRSADVHFHADREHALLTQGIPGSHLPSWLARATGTNVGTQGTAPGILVVRSAAVRSSARFSHRPTTIAAWTERFLSQGWTVQAGGEAMLWTGQVPAIVDAGPVGPCAEMNVASQGRASAFSDVGPLPCDIPGLTGGPIPNSPVYIACDRYDLDDGRYTDRVPSLRPRQYRRAFDGRSPAVAGEAGIKSRSVEIIRQGLRVGTVTLAVDGGGLPAGAIDEAIVDQLGYTCGYWVERPMPEETRSLWSARVAAWLLDPTGLPGPLETALVGSPRAGVASLAKSSTDRRIRLSVVVVVTDGDGSLNFCLAAVRDAADRTTANVEVDLVLVDAGASPAAVSAISDTLPMTRVPALDVDAAGCRRIGLDHVRKGASNVVGAGDVPTRSAVVFLRPTTIVEPDSLSQICTLFSRTGVDAVAAAIGLRIGQRVGYGAASLDLGATYGRLAVYSREREIDGRFLAAANGCGDLLALDLDALPDGFLWPEAVVGTDGGRCLGDDVEMCIGLLRSGRAVAIAPSIVGWEWAHFSLASRRRRRRSASRARLAAALSWAGPSWWGRKHVAQFVLPRTVASFASVVNGRRGGRVIGLIDILDTGRVTGRRLFRRSAPELRPDESTRPGGTASGPLRVVGGRFGHHASSSGYDRMFLQSAQFVPGVQFRWVSHRRVERLGNTIVHLSGHDIYSLGAFFNECVGAVSMVRHRRDHFHLLYADTDAFLLPKLARTLRVDLSASLHVPSHRLAELDIDLSRLRGARAVVVMDESERAYVEPRVRPAPIVVARHGVDTAMFRPGSAEPVREFLCCGAHLRDFATLFDAWSRFCCTDDRYRLVLIGAGPGARTLLERFPLERVDMPARLTDAELVRRYQRCAAFVLPLLDATANNSLLEAMACGRPVITTDLPAVRSYARDGAWYVPPRDGEALAGAMTKLVGDPEQGQALGERAREVTLALSFDVVGPALVAAITSSSSAAL